MASSISPPVPPAEESSSPIALFRQEVVDFQQNERQFGQVGLLQPISITIMTWFITAFVALAILLLLISPYSRKATVEGYLKTTTGTAKIFALQRGTITSVEVSEGQDVQKGQQLLTIDTTQISATGEDVNVVMLDTLLNQRDQLNRQIGGEEQQMASEQERLTLLIQGLKNEITQIEAQIPLQQSRISLAESLVESVAYLVKKGAVTDVEYKRRQAEALDQRQGLNSQRQQLAAKQNELTNNQYSLSQLPIVTAAKIQLLRNELSTIEQRVAEINGRRAFVIRAPMAGRVTALQASIGKVAEPNQLQLEIVPSSSTLKAELFVPSRSIGFVQAGQRVSIRYAAFPYENFGRYAGTIIEISKNILTSSDSPSSPIELKQPAYRVTATLDRQDIDAYGKRMPLQAGMLLEADIVLDRRSLMRWVLDPLLSVRGQLDAGL
jgi:membrane fusion protein